MLVWDKTKGTFGEWVWIPDELVPDGSVTLQKAITKKGKKMNKKEMARKIELMEIEGDARLDIMANDREKFEQLQKEVNCAEDYGHDYVFVEKVESLGTFVPKFAQNLIQSAMYGSSMMKYEACAPSYRYKCSRCGRAVDYTWDELTVKERHALETLGVV